MYFIYKSITKVATVLTYLQRGALTDLLVSNIAIQKLGRGIITDATIPKTKYTTLRPKFYAKLVSAITRRI